MTLPWTAALPEISPILHWIAAGQPAAVS